jgi:hypothetical protein
MLGSADRGHVFRADPVHWRGATAGRWNFEALRRDGISAASALEEMTAVLQAMAAARPCCPREGRRSQRASSSGAIGCGRRTRRLAATTM